MVTLEKRLISEFDIKREINNAIDYSNEGKVEACFGVIRILNNNPSVDKSLLLNIQNNAYYNGIFSLINDSKKYLKSNLDTAFKIQIDKISNYFNNLIELLNCDLEKRNPKYLEENGINYSNILYLLNDSVENAKNGNLHTAIMDFEHSKRLQKKKFTSINPEILVSFERVIYMMGFINILDRVKNDFYLRDKNNALKGLDFAKEYFEKCFSGVIKSP